VTLTDDDTGSAQAQVAVAVAGLADLQVTGDVSPVSVQVGDNTTLSFTVNNAGPGAASNVRLTQQVPSSLQIQSSSPGYTLQNGSLVFSLGTIASGATRQVQLVVKGSAAGTFVSTATAQADETDPLSGNNSTTVNVLVTPINAPDLEPALVNATQKCKAHKSGMQCTVKAKMLVANNGNVPTGKSEVALYISQDASLGAGDTLVKALHVKALNPGKSQLLNVQVKLPKQASASGRYLIAVSDSAQQWIESNEANNSTYLGPLP
jgi:uncharacterized repeat protein (TIGR01451 family)